MKLKIFPALFASAIVLGALFFINRQTAAPTIHRQNNAPSIGQAAKLSPASVLPQAAALAQPSNGPGKITEAFDNFSRWATLFTNSSASLVEGERLAWKRREAMLDLIENDPQTGG